MPSGSGFFFSVFQCVVLVPSVLFVQDARYTEPKAHCSLSSSLQEMFPRPNICYTVRPSKRLASLLLTLIFVVSVLYTASAGIVNIATSLSQLSPLGFLACEATVVSCCTCIFGTDGFTS
jgi:hypothetical protein